MKNEGSGLAGCYVVTTGRRLMAFRKVHDVCIFGLKKSNLRLRELLGPENRGGWSSVPGQSIWDLW